MVLGFSVFHPIQLVALPLALMVAALPPRSLHLIVLAIALAAAAFLGPREGLWGVERGWSLLVGGWFILAKVAWPKAGFTARAVAAVLTAAATGAILIATSGGWAGVEWRMQTRFREDARTIAAAFPRLGETEAVVERAAELPSALYPGLLAIGSVAALALAWWAYVRLTGRGEPLGRLRDFRFPDALVWLLIAGLVLVVLPLAEAAPRVGGNVLLFMGSLYALRGAAVVLALIGWTAPKVIALAVVGVLLWPIVMTGTLVVGVADTWLDLRAAGRAAEDDG
ncbi:MAG TPA: DUF2232 domain-containing protein [Longimicrobiales bacterium]|nr:DUF2232 domain-containing protein [Longimicrobiales bacterium]